jgi:peptidoglycan/LPS O-acetylase OafA/YrhL
MSTADARRPAFAGPFGRVIRFFRNWSTSQTAYPLGYVAALDGSRGLMTLGVMLAHTRMALFGGAMVYMDVFFCMSGYLITSLLIAEHDKHGAISLKKFYVRRLRRLYPALTAMLAALLVFSALLSPEFRLRATEAAVSFAYLSDYWRAFGGVGVHYTAHTWSLAVEEQFYILWPAAFILLIRRHGISWAAVAIVFAAAVGFALWRIWLTYEGASIARLYNSFDTRADALLAGCGLALLLRLVDLEAHPRLSSICANSLLPLAAFMVALGFSADANWHSYYYFSPLLGAIPALVGITGLLQHRRTLMHAVYEQPVAVFCGRICYGLYIWHYPVFVVVADNIQPAYRYISVFLIGWPVTFALATASYVLIERRFMRTRPL